MNLVELIQLVLQVMIVISQLLYLFVLQLKLYILLKKSHLFFSNFLKFFSLIHFDLLLDVIQGIYQS